MSVNVKRFDMLKEMMEDIIDYKPIDNTKGFIKDWPKGLRWLQYLIHILVQKLPPRQFTMTAWHCGSAACVIGHAALRKEFQKEGLYMDHGVPRFNDKHTYDAIADFFGIEFRAAVYLFERGYYDQDLVRPLDVYFRVCEFIDWTPEERKIHLDRASRDRYRKCL